MARKVSRPSGPVNRLGAAGRVSTTWRTYAVLRGRALRWRGGGGDGGGGPPPAVVASVTISPPEPDTLFSLGQQLALAAAPRDGAGNEVQGATVTFASANDAIATVTNAGVVTAAGVGATAVTAAAQAVSSAPLPIRVRQKLDNVAVTSPSTSVLVGAALQMTASPHDARGNAIPNLPPATCESSDATRASVDPATGLVTGVAVGQATITATVTSPTDGAKSGSRLVTVSSDAPPLTATVRTGSGNAFTPAAVRIKVGGTVTWELPAAHNADFEDESIADIAFGANESRTFATTGTFRFRCDAHSTDFTSGMVGTITVVP
jgi:plastocyanin